MYIKLGRLNILPTSDPKSANSRYFQGHQLINVRFLSQSQPPNGYPSSIVVNMAVAISLPASIVRKLIYRRLFNIDKKSESISINKIICPLLTRIISYPSWQPTLSKQLMFPSPFNEDHFISAF